MYELDGSHTANRGGGAGGCGGGVLHHFVPDESSGMQFFWSLVSDRPRLGEDRLKHAFFILQLVGFSLI